MSYFAVRVALITTEPAILQIDSNFAAATVTIDDSTEPECCKLILYNGHFVKTTKCTIMYIAGTFFSVIFQYSYFVKTNRYLVATIAC